MNKNAKAAIAVGAGTLLLLGGGGTFALWNATTGSLSAGTITTGTLAVDTTDHLPWADAEWTVNGTDDYDSTEFASFLAVPGDTFEFTATADIVASGDNLEFTVLPSDLDAIETALAATGWTFDSGTGIEVDIDDVDGAFTTTDDVDNATSAYSPASLPATFDLYRFTDAATANSGHATITVTFSGTYGSNSANGDNGTQDSEIAFGSISFAIQQVFEN